MERGAEIGLPVADLLALIKPVDKVSFQPGINVKIIGLLKGSPCADISV